VDAAAAGADGVGLLRPNPVHGSRERAGRGRAVRSVRRSRPRLRRHISRHHSHARRRRRQAAGLPAAAKRGQSVSRHSRHPSRAAPRRPAAHAAAGESPRLAPRPRAGDVPDGDDLRRMDVGQAHAGRGAAGPWASRRYRRGSWSKCPPSR
jgi:hypothetical protein